MNNENTKFCPIPNTCPDNYGNLPSCAGLAVPYVPFQQNNPEKYSQSDALRNGTLFPSLNLPFHLKMTGGAVPEGPTAELQALDFVLTELGHYMDTHPEDKETFAMFQQYAAMCKAAKADYQAAYGPLTRPATAQHATYSWLSDPWPWNYDEVN